MMTMRVIHIISTGSLAGTEQYLLHLLDHASPGVQAAVCCPAGSPLHTALRVRGHVALGCDFAPRALPATTLRLVAWLRRVRPAVVHTHLGKATLVGAVAARLAGVPGVVTTQHFLVPAHDSTHPPLVRPLFRLGHRVVNGLLDRVITVSQAAGEAMVMREGLPSNRLIHIPHGINPKDFTTTTNKAVLRQTIGLPLEAPLVITVGRLEWEKGYEALIAALPAVIQSHPAAHFVWVGSGSQAEGYQAAISALGLQERVHLLGQRPDVAACLAAADVAVCPAPQEGFGLAVIEAMAAGLPVVAIAAGGPAEIVVPGETGRLVPYTPAALAGAIGDLLADPAGAQAMGAAGRRRVAARYTITRMVRQTEDVYADLARGPRLPAPVAARRDS